MAEKRAELSFRQITAAGGVTSADPAKLFGLTEDGKVFMFQWVSTGHPLGWTPLPMVRAPR